MPQTDPRREAALRIVETSRLLRSLVELRLRPFGMTRAQYSTLARLERQEGLVQNELAEILEIQPIGMVRLIDQLSAEVLIERRPDPSDRRCNRLFITEAGRERLSSLASFKEELGAEVFAGIENADLHQMLSTLTRLHQNIKDIQAADLAAAKLQKAGAG
jgi:MarR family transcriptional regulator, transcriptional regulator for hemolysin